MREWEIEKMRVKIEGVTARERKEEDESERK